MFFNSNYLLLMIVSIALGAITQAYIRSTFNKWSRVRGQKGYTGAQVAELLLQRNNIAAQPGAKTGEGAVAVRPVGGHLSDHYDPRTGIIALSEPVYDKNSIAAVAVAAHETGHAIQDAENYSWGEIRTAIVPVVNFGSSIAGILILFGFFVGISGLMWLGIAGYGLAVLFQIVTLPVELNASKRALVQLNDAGVLSPQEIPAARQVLTSAALTYVAAALISVLNLLYYIGLARD